MRLVSATLRHVCVISAFRGLAGRIDIVLPRDRSVILVHGRLSQRHIVCAKGVLSANSRAWSLVKLRPNRARDGLNIRDLHTAGWRVIVVWECELGVARGTVIQRAARLERVGRSLVREVTGRSSGP